MENILDDINQPEIDNKKPITRLIQIFVGSIVLFILLELLSDYMPLNWVTTIVLIPFNAILLPKYLNQIQPNLGLLKVSVYTVLILGLLILVFYVIKFNLFPYFNF